VDPRDIATRFTPLQCRKNVWPFGLGESCGNGPLHVAGDWRATVIPVVAHTVLSGRARRQDESNSNGESVPSDTVRSIPRDGLGTRNENTPPQAGRALLVQCARRSDMILEAIRPPGASGAARLALTGEQKWTPLAEITRIAPTFPK
jgi:hypothetical protein